MTEAACVIVGGGQAGGRAAEALRQHGFTGRITLVGAEPWAPYERPPLSKSVLIGGAPATRGELHDAAFWRDQAIDLMLGQTVQAIDRRAARVQLADGRTLPYDWLLLATGARPRRLDLPGGEHAPLYYLRSRDDCLALRERLTQGARLVIIGGGFIGLEVAAAARARGTEVTILEAAGAILARVMAPEVARAIAELHREQGVVIRTGARIEGFAPDAVRLAGGERIAAETILVGIGAVPNAELAQEAGLAIDNGIAVDEFTRTSDPRIAAAGDATSHPNPLLGRRIRLESWQNAQNQAIVAARNICGENVPYAELPWFWSDQYECNLQMIGLPLAWDRVVLRGDVAGRRFSAFYLAAGRLVAANCVNNARDIAPARTLITRGAKPAPEALADAGVALRDLARASA